MKPSIWGVLALLLLTLSHCSSREAQLQSEGDALVEEIELFRADQGRLPANLMELGKEETEEGPLYYQLEGENEYLVHFGLELGHSMVYRSARGEWKKE